MSLPQLALEHVAIVPDNNALKLTGTIKNTGTADYSPLAGVRMNMYNVTEADATGPDLTYNTRVYDSWSGWKNVMPKFLFSTREYTSASVNAFSSDLSPKYQTSNPSGAATTAEDAHFNNYIYLDKDSYTGHQYLEYGGSKRFINASVGVLLIDDDAFKATTLVAGGPGWNFEFRIIRETALIGAGIARDKFAIVVDPVIVTFYNSKPSSGSVIESVDPNFYDADNNLLLDSNGDLPYPGPDARWAVVENVDAGPALDIDITLNINSVEHVSTAKSAAVKYTINSTGVEVPYTLTHIVAEVTTDPTDVISNYITTTNSSFTPEFTDAGSRPGTSILGGWAYNFETANSEWSGNRIQFTSGGVVYYVKHLLAVDSSAPVAGTGTSSQYTIMTEHPLYQGKTYAVIADQPDNLIAEATTGGVTLEDNNAVVLDGTVLGYTDSLQSETKIDNLLKQVTDATTIVAGTVYKVGRGMRYRFLNAPNAPPDSIGFTQKPELVIADTDTDYATERTFDLGDSITLTYQVVDTVKIKVTDYGPSTYNRPTNLAQWLTTSSPQPYNYMYGVMALYDLHNTTQAELDVAFTGKLDPAAVEALIPAPADRTAENYYDFINRLDGALATPVEDGTADHNSETNYVSTEYFLRVPTVGHYALFSVRNGQKFDYDVQVEIVDETDNSTKFNLTNSSIGSYASGVWINQDMQTDLRIKIGELNPDTQRPYIYSIEDLNNYDLGKSTLIAVPQGSSVVSHTQGTKTQTSFSTTNFGTDIVYTVNAYEASAVTEVALVINDGTADTTYNVTTDLQEPISAWNVSPYTSDFEIINPVLDVAAGVVRFTLRQNGAPFTRSLQPRVAVVTVNETSGPLTIDRFNDTSAAGTPLGVTYNSDFMWNFAYGTYVDPLTGVTEVIGSPDPLPVEWNDDGTPKSYARKLVGGVWLHEASNLVWRQEVTLEIPILDQGVTADNGSIIQRWGTGRFAVIYDHSNSPPDDNQFRLTAGYNAFEGYAEGMTDDERQRPNNPAEMNNLAILPAIYGVQPSIEFFLGSVTFDGNANRAINDVTAPADLSAINYKVEGDVTSAELVAAMKNIAIKYSAPNTDYASPLPAARIDAMVATQTLGSSNEPTFDLGAAIAVADVGKLAATIPVSSLFDASTGGDAIEVTDSSNNTYQVQVDNSVGLTFASALPKALLKQLNISGNNEVVGRNVLEPASVKNLAAFGIKEVGATDADGITGVKLNDLLKGIEGKDTVESSWDAAASNSGAAPNTRYLAHEIILAIFRNNPPGSNDVSIVGVSTDTSKLWRYDPSTGLLYLQNMAALTISLDFVLLSKLSVKDQGGTEVAYTNRHPEPGSPDDYVWESPAMSTDRRVAIRFTLNVIP